MSKNDIDDGMHTVYRVVGCVLNPVREKRPDRPPEHCHISNEDLECLGCGVKLGCIKSGHCYFVEGEAAKKS